MFVQIAATPPTTDVAAAQIVCQRGLAAVGYTVKMQGVWGNSLESPRPKNPCTFRSGSIKAVPSAETQPAQKRKWLFIERPTQQNKR